MTIIGAQTTAALANLTDGRSFGLGDRYTDHSGNVWVFCQANGAITANNVVLLDEDYQAAAISTTNTASARGQQCGVAGATLADNEYGWVQVYGVATFTVKENCGANAVLNSTASGGALDDDSTTGAEVINGIVLTTANSTGTANKEGVLTFPTVGATEV